MRRKRVLWFIPVAIVGLALFVFIGGEVVMRLWNWLLPDLFGFKPITFWPALGILTLCRILFGGGLTSHATDMRGRMRRRMSERWDRMTPEEREKYCQGAYGRWGREGGEPKAGG